MPLRPLRPLVFCAALACAIVSSGCASVMSEVIAAKKQGTEGITVDYPVTENQAWDIAKAVLRDSGGQAIEEHRADAYMLTASPASLGVSGALVGVWIRQSGPATTSVTVISKRQIKSALLVAPTESKIHDRIAQAVERMQKDGASMSVLPEAGSKG